jgi:hypothetical protein
MITLEGRTELYTSRTGYKAWLVDLSDLNAEEIEQIARKTGEDAARNLQWKDAPSFCVKGCDSRHSAVWHLHFGRGYNVGLGYPPG